MKTKLFTLVLLSLFALKTQASSILASSFGWNGQDDTQALYDAFTFEADTLIVDLQDGDWISGPLIFEENVNDKVIIFEAGVVLRALEGAYDDMLYRGLLTFFNCQHVTLIGYGARLQMNKEEYIALNDGSEWRHTIALRGCRNVKIFGLELVSSGGDGIEISGLWQQAVPSEDIHIKNCKIDDNYRQGISITSAKNVLIEHCEITNTSGTPPAFGIDLEPDNTYDQLDNIRIQSCRISGNEGGGLLCSLWNLDDSSEPVNIKVSDCYIASNQHEGIVIDVNASSAPTGYLYFENCLIENQPGNAIFSDKRASVSLTFKNMVIRNTGTDGGPYDMPVFIQSPYDYSGEPVGNLQFTNILIDDLNFNRDFLNISHWGNASGVENVHGNFIVKNASNGNATYHIEGPQQNVDLDVESYTYIPLSHIELWQNNDSIAYEQGSDTTVSFHINRSANYYDHPLPVFFDFLGTAENRLDYDYHPGVQILPPDSTDLYFTLSAVDDGLEEEAEEILLRLGGDPLNYYLPQPPLSEIHLFIGGMPVGVATQEASPSQELISIAPNPASETLTISTRKEVRNGRLSLFNLSGQELLQAPFSGRHTTLPINLQHLPKGTYFICVESQEGLSCKKIQVQ
ncbi:MAG TPA: T9SS type A sorting domain-containing protein [Phaeodactylibacter sp.]|nr:T9SS type A sorting domain-containing protein [Phaeodactylibacter sp.]